MNNFENVVCKQYIPYNVLLCVYLRGGLAGFGLEWPTIDFATSYFLHSKLRFATIWALWMVGVQQIISSRAYI